MSFESLASKLVPFETFDEKVFIEGSNTPQRVCDFVLALALAYNDFKDVFVARKLLEEIPSDQTRPPTPALAQRNGIENRIVRVQFGFIHELLTLLIEESQTISDPAFVRIIKKISSQAKRDWHYGCGEFYSIKRRTDWLRVDGLRRVETRHEKPTV